MPKLLIAILLCLGLHLESLASASKKTVLIKKEAYTVKDFMKEIETQTGLKFVYFTNNIPLKKKVIIQKDKYKLDELLTFFLWQINIEFIISENGIAIRQSNKSSSKQNDDPIFISLNPAEFKSSNLQKSDTTKKIKKDTLKIIKNDTIPVIAKKIKKDSVVKVIEKESREMTVLSLLENRQLVNFANKKAENTLSFIKIEPNKTVELEYDFEKTEDIKLKNNIQIIGNQEIYNHFYPLFINANLNADLFDQKFNFKKIEYTETELKTTIGTAGSKVTFGSSFFDKKLNYTSSLRYFYSDFVADNISKIGSLSINGNEGYNFDFAQNIDLAINQKNTVKSSLYYSNTDDFSKNRTNYRIYWQNLLTSLAWQHILSEKSTLNSTISYYKHDVYQNKWIRNHAQEIERFSFCENLDHSFENENSLSLGAYCEMERNEISRNTIVNKRQFIAPELQLKSEINLNSNFSVNANFKMKYLKHLNNDSLSKSYSLLSPNIALNLRTDSSFKIILKLAYSDEANQEAIRFTNKGIPVNMIVPASKEIKPLSKNTIELSIQKNFGKSTNLSMLVGYSLLKNVIDFKDSIDLSNSNTIESQVSSGTGKELYFNFAFQNNSKFHELNLSYAFNDSKYKIDGINSGIEYKKPFASKHNIDASLGFIILKQIKVSANFQLISGRFFTLPKNVTFVNSNLNAKDGKSAFEMPIFQTLDLSLTYIANNKNSKIKNQFEIKIRNAYNNQNYYYPSFNGKNVYFVYLNGVYPELKYSLKF